jgi:hypothetical protein
MSTHSKPVEKMNMAELWLWLQEHPVYVLDGIWEALPCALYVQYVSINPKTLLIDKDDTKNTKVRCWLEFGQIEYQTDPQTGETITRTNHDIDLDCGGDTFEEAFRTLCLRVLKKDGDYAR